MNNDIKFGSSAREVLRKGIAVAGGVAVRTLGPGGSNVKKSEYGSARNTKDGYYAIKGLKVKDAAENEGIAILQSASDTLNTEVGDNTTTVMVLSDNMTEAAQKVLSVGSCNRNELCSGLQWGCEYSIKVLREHAVQVSGPEMVARVATVSSNGNADIGNRIAEIHGKLGNPLIHVELSNSTETTHEVVAGLKVDRGYISPYFITNTAKSICEFERPLVLVCKEKISTVSSVVPILEHAVNANKPLFIVAEDVCGEALAAMIVNKLRGGIKVAAIKAPSFGSDRDAVLQDIATLTGAQVISSEVGRSLENAVECLGEASSVVVSKDDACIVNAEANRDLVRARCDQIALEIAQTKTQYEREKLEERFSKLMYGVAVVRVGGDNEVHAKELKDLVEDAVCAARAAKEEGIVAGGGATYSWIANALRNELPGLRGTRHHDWIRGVEIVVEALSAIEHNILMNAEQCRDRVAQIKNTLQDRRAAGRVIPGYDARKHELRDDMIAEIMDSVKGVRLCIGTAIRNTIDFVNTDVLITELPEEKDAAAGPGAGRMY